ncbi:MAG: LytTR family transcriptional regulator [Bacteroidetes bacterium]|nr:LytTR family transcriptional regulator [Bacteroidota bacterium]
MQHGKNVLFLRNNSGRDYAISYTLDQLEELLDPAKFFRINRKFIVSFSAISDIISFSNSRLQVHLHTYKSNELVVSREKVQEFKSG